MAGWLGLVKVRKLGWIRVSIRVWIRVSVRGLGLARLSNTYIYFSWWSELKLHQLSTLNCSKLSTINCSKLGAKFSMEY